MAAERRALFLAGAGTLTFAEVREWADEVEPGVFDGIPGDEVADDRALMVSVLREEREACSRCGVARENCKPGGQWYSVCPFHPANGGHDWQTVRVPV